MVIENYRGEMLLNERMSQYTTWKIGGKARYFALPKDSNDVAKLLDYCHRDKVRYVLIGNGSNILFPDEDFDGMVICLKKGLKGKEIISYTDDGALIYVGAGEMVSEILSFCLRNRLAGLEFLAGVPATFGGLVKMNGGAFGNEIKDVLEWVNFYISNKGFVTKIREELRFGYRKLDAPSDWVILGGAVRLKFDDEINIRERIRENVMKRKNSQPLSEKTCGSVFKNPPGDYAGRIIEELGLKGYRVGGAKVSEKHANFIVNTGNATAKDVLTLIEMIKQKVWYKKGVILEEEVVIINKSGGAKVVVL